MYIYLAHPIDQADWTTTSPMLKVTGVVRRMALDQGHWLFAPARAHLAPTLTIWSAQDAVKVDDINRHAIRQADGVIAVLMPEVPTLGTPSEIEFALTLGKPVLILTTSSMRTRSVQIASWIQRGANCVLVGEDGHLSDLDLARDLAARNEAVDATPALQVRYSGSEQTISRGKYEGDAGIDLALARDEGLAIGEYQLLPTGAHVAIPDGYFGLITGRSSTWAKYRCDVRHAVIDSGYRGELMIGIENRGLRHVMFEAGTRLAQMVLLPVWSGDIRPVDKLPDHERGENGYGSSGAR